MWDDSENRTIALIKGKQIPYDVCGFKVPFFKKWRYYSRKHFRYIGKGTIYRVRGRLKLDSDTVYDFWQYKDNPRGGIE